MKTANRMRHSMRFRKCFATGIVLSSMVLCMACHLDATEVEVLIGSTEKDPGATVKPGELNAPFAVCFEPDDSMWIVEYDGGRLLRWSAEQGLVHVAGDGTAGYADGNAKLAQFNQLHNVTRLPDGRLVMSDHLNHALRMYDPKTQLVSTLGGDGTAGFQGDGKEIALARFNQPICVEMAADGQALFIADIRNRRLRKMTLDHWIVSTVGGNGQTGIPTDGQQAIESPLLDPRAAVSDREGNIYFVERGGHALRMIDRQAAIKTLIGTGKPGFDDGSRDSATLNGPKHLCLDPGQAIYIADDNNHAIRRYDLKTGLLTTVDFSGYRLKRPHGVAVHRGWLYVADSYHHRVLRIKIANG